MGILEKEVVGDFKREKEIEEGYKNRSTLSVEDRLRLMWREDIYGRLSPELTAVSQCSSMALLMGEKNFFYFAVYTTTWRGHQLMVGIICSLVGIGLNMFI